MAAIPLVAAAAELVADAAAGFEAYATMAAPYVAAAGTTYVGGKAMAWGEEKVHDVEKKVESATKRLKQTITDRLNRAGKAAVREGDTLKQAVVKKAKIMADAHFDSTTSKPKVTNNKVDSPYRNMPRIPKRRYRNTPSKLTRTVRAPAAKVELKVRDFPETATAASLVAVDLTPNVVQVAVIDHGDGAGNRQGRSIQLRKIQFNCYAYPQSTAQQSQILDLYCVYDKFPQGALPAISLMFDNATTGFGLTEKNHQQRFVFLKHKRVVLNGAGNFNSIERKKFEMHISLRNRPTVYTHTTSGAVQTGVIANIKEGALYLVTIGNQVAGTTAAVLEFYQRVTFLDA